MRKQRQLVLTSTGTGSGWPATGLFGRQENSGMFAKHIHAGTCRHIQAHAGICRHMQAHAGTCRHITLHEWVPLHLPSGEDQGGLVAKLPRLLGSSPSLSSASAVWPTPASSPPRYRRRDCSAFPSLFRASASSSAAAAPPQPVPSDCSAGFSRFFASASSCSAAAAPPHPMPSKADSMADQVVAPHTRSNQPKSSPTDLTVGIFTGRPVRAVRGRIRAASRTGRNVWAVGAHLRAAQLELHIACPPSDNCRPTAAWRGAIGGFLCGIQEASARCALLCRQPLCALVWIRLIRGGEASLPWAESGFVAVGCNDA